MLKHMLKLCLKCILKIKIQPTNATFCPSPSPKKIPNKPKLKQLQTSMQLM